jgi:hypothetical protein
MFQDCPSSEDSKSDHDGHHDYAVIVYHSDKHNLLKDEDKVAVM